MKNQYFGDVRDYLKYGALRCFAASGLELGVCWLLTRDDGSNDGNNRNYLQDPAWRDHDPELYDFLQVTCARPSGRQVGNLEQSGLLPARYFSEIVPESEAERVATLERAWEQLSGSHLLFFDPDNGVEVRSTLYGGRGSSRYIFWREIEAFWEQGVSLLIFQHFPRQDHGTFVTNVAEALRSHTPGSTVYTLTTQAVVYLLAVQPQHVGNVEYALTMLNKRFGEHFEMAIAAEPEPSEPELVQPEASVPQPAVVEEPPKYPITVFWSEANGGWVAQLPDWPQVSALAETPQSAVEKALAALDHWVKVSREEGTPLPPARDVGIASLR